MDRSERLSLSSQAPLCAEDRKITWRDIQVTHLRSSLQLTSCSEHTAHGADPAAHPGCHTHRHPLRLQQRPPPDGGRQGSRGGRTKPPGEPEHGALDEHQELCRRSLNDNHGYILLSTYQFSTVNVYSVHN